jgi:hypothetical protein
VFDDVASFGFDDGGGYLWMRGYAAEGRDGADLVVRNLASGASANFGNVTEHAWQADAPRLAMTIATESGAGNGIQLYDATPDALRVLDSGNATFTEPTWREDAADLAVLRSVEDEAYEEPTHVILAWRGLDAGVPEPLRLDPLARADFAQLGDMGTTSSGVTSAATTSSSAASTGIASRSAPMRVVERRAPSWSDDGDPAPKARQVPSD